MARKGGGPADRVLNAMTLSGILRYSTSSRARSSGRLTWHSRAPMDDLVLEGAVVAVASGGGNHFSSPLRDGKDSASLARHSAAVWEPREAAQRAGILPLWKRTGTDGSEFE
jgi:hypothetical protein